MVWDNIYDWLSILKYKIKNILKCAKVSRKLSPYEISSETKSQASKPAVLLVSLKNPSLIKICIYICNIINNI